MVPSETALERGTGPEPVLELKKNRLFETGLELIPKIIFFGTDFGSLIRTRPETNQNQTRTETDEGTGFANKIK